MLLKKCVDKLQAKTDFTYLMRKYEHIVRYGEALIDYNI